MPTLAEKTAIYSPGDLVQLHPAYGSSQVVITGIKPKATVNIYTGVINSARSTGKEYVLSNAHIARKIGTVELDAITIRDKAKEREDNYDAEYGQRFARQMAEGSVHADKWLHLATLNPGDGMLIRRVTKKGVKVVRATFLRVHGAGKYAFVAQKETGGTYRFPIGQLVIPPQ